MKIGYFPSRIALLLFLALLGPGTVLSAEVLDKVVAVVNDEVITQSELDQYLAPLYEQYKKVVPQDEFLLKMNEARQSLLNQLIEDKLVYQEAKRVNVPVTEEEVTARLDEFKASFKSEEEFNKLLAAQGLTLTKLRDRYREQLAIRKLHQHHIRSKIIVTPKDVEEYYQANMEKFSKTESVRAKTITIRKSEASVESKEPDPEARQKVEAVLKQLFDGAPFEELAKKYSEDTKAGEGGDLGFIEKGDMIKEVDDVIFTLKAGDISPVIETEMGYHLFKIEEKKERETRNLDDVRPEIEDMLFREQSQKRFKEWMEDLKKNAYISIR